MYSTAPISDMAKNIYLIAMEYLVNWGSTMRRVGVILSMLGYEASELLNATMSTNDYYLKLRLTNTGTR